MGEVCAALTMGMPVAWGAGVGGMRTTGTGPVSSGLCSTSFSSPNSSSRRGGRSTLVGRRGGPKRPRSLSALFEFGRGGVVGKALSLPIHISNNFSPYVHRNFWPNTERRR